MITEANPLFQKATPSRDQIKEVIYLMDQQFSEEMAQIIKEDHYKAEQLSEISRPFQEITHVDPQKAADAISALEKFDKLAFEKQSLKLSEALKGIEEQKNLTISFDSRLRVGGPPYDVSWTSGGFCSANKDTGEFRINPVNGFAGAGVGMYVIPKQDTIGSFSAHVPIDYSWTNWNYKGGAAFSRGGVRVKIENFSGEQGPFYSEPFELWNAGGTPWLVRHEDYTVLVHTPAAETFFYMKANVPYLIWVWCWGYTQVSGSGAISLASITCNMPYFVLKPAWF
ncbi:hypothetical protein [Chitinophaga japonensis]|uniref:Uncharacterized protein n=1 Tax=Chitinophaga japonensis TaxID=104662 RepID=A0A562T0C3_CHIJA|nr:hypothetical protein [Chitinophaga japonensis]TWI86971.1 hypothetical protein LX66_4238 [Chitinophaga japonensis]